MLLGKVGARRGRHRRAVDDAQVGAHILRRVLLHPAADGEVHLLRLGGATRLARPDRPHGLIRQHHLRPVRHLARQRLQLLEDHLVRPLLLALHQRLPDGDDDAQPQRDRVRRFQRNHRVGLAQDVAPLGVARNHPPHAHVGQLVRADLAREGAALGAPAVLRRDVDARRQRGDDLREVDVGGADDEVDVVVELRRVEVGDKLVDGGLGAVALPVAAQEELPSRGRDVGREDAGADRVHPRELHHFQQQLCDLLLVQPGPSNESLSSFTKRPCCE